MPQLVNQRCVLCGERIESEIEGSFCTLCGAPVHDHCKDPEAAGQGECPGCGGDATDEEAARERLRLLQESAAERFRQTILRGDDPDWFEKRRHARAEVFGGAGLLVGGLLLVFLFMAAGAGGPGSLTMLRVLALPLLFGVILLARGLSHFWHT